MKNMFNFEEVKDFDNHINISIPNYNGLIDIVTALSYEYMNPMGTCIDLGCSTGKFLNSLTKLEGGRYIGCDIVTMADDYDFEFIQGDCLDVLKGVEETDIIFSIFTLQFLGKHKRKLVLEELKRKIDGGSAVIIAEKVYSSTSKVQAVMTREHIKQKRENFTSDEILDKDTSLSGVMFCNNIEEMTAELDFLGNWEPIWQSYNFRAWIVYK